MSPDSTTRFRIGKQWFRAPDIWLAGAAAQLKREDSSLSPLEATQIACHKWAEQELIEEERRANES